MAGQWYRRLGWSWISLCLALTIHVTDEAVTDFLSVYNPVAARIRQNLPWLPIPTFTFRLWLFGLIGAIVVLLLLSPFAFRGSRWLRPFAYFFAVLMIANALGHTLGSFYLGRLMPGVISSPVLFAAAVALLVSLWQTRKLLLQLDEINR